MKGLFQDASRLDISPSILDAYEYVTFGIPCVLGPLSRDKLGIKISEKAQFDAKWRGSIHGP
jgi:hypothetical protein